MNLLYVCSDFGIRPTGTKGASIHVRSITKAICALGHEVALVSPYGGPGRGHPADAMRPARGCPPSSWSKRLGGWLKKRELPASFAQELRPLLYNTWAVPHLEDKLRGHAPDAILERLSLFGHVGVDLAQSLKRPLIIEVNALLSREAKQFRTLELKSLAEQIEQRVLLKADEIIVVSDQLRAPIEALGVRRSRIHVVPNGADEDVFDSGNVARTMRKELGMNGEFVVGFAGSLKPWHGVDLLLSAFERILEVDKNAKLLIVGSGPMEEQLRTTIRQKGLEPAVVLTGPVQHARIPAYLRTMDVAVAPFSSIDGFYFSPIKLFEYMAARRCIVATRLGQIRDVVSHESTGLLCKPDDVDSLAEALLRLRRDQQLRERLADAGRKRFEERFTWNKAAESVMRVIERRIQKRTRSLSSPQNPRVQRVRTR